MHGVKKSIVGAAAPIIAAAGVYVAWTAPAAAATCTWTGGGASNVWSVPANWDGCGAGATSGAVPSSGDVLVFPAGAAGDGTSQNDFAGLTPGAIQILGTTSANAAYAIGGNGIALAGRSLVFGAAVAASGAGPSVETPILLGGALTVANGGKAPATVGAVHFDNNLTLTVDAAPGDVRLDGAVTGAGHLVKSGAGALIIVGLAQWSGPTDILAGTLHTGAAGSLPTTGVVTLSPSTTLDLTASAAAQTIGGLQGAGGAVMLPAAAGLTIAQSAPTAFNGAIHGSAAGAVLVLAGSGSLQLGGSQANDYAASTLVTAGSLQLAKPSGAAGIGTGGLDVEGGEVRLLGDEQIPDATVVTVGAGGTLNLNGQTETLAGIVGAGRVDLGNGTLTLSSSNASLFMGSLAGTGPLLKRGDGTLTLAGDSSATYTGSIAARGGVVLVNGSVAQSALTLTFGELGGTGTIGSVDAPGGQFFPGTGGAAGVPRRLRVANSLSLGNGTSLSVEIDGPAPGVDYGVVDVGGPVTLDGVTLVVGIGSGFHPPLASTYTLLTKAGTAPIAGTFAGHPEASTFVAGGQAFVITYAGGDGNDVMLIAVPTPCQLLPGGCGGPDAGTAADGGADASDDAATTAVDAGAGDAAVSADAPVSGDAAVEAPPPAADAAREASDEVPPLPPPAADAAREASDEVPPLPPPDAGAADARDAGTGATDAVIADTSTGADSGHVTGGGGGCGCDVGSSSSGAAGALLLAGLALLARLRHRR
jgi:MYXO-CTERM domain-containing protein